jgi:hypothetical protein
LYSEDMEDGDLEEVDDESDGADSVTLSKEEFFRMLEQETKEAISRMRSMRGREDEEFAKYAESFLKQI